MDVLTLVRVNTDDVEKGVGGSSEPWSLGCSPQTLLLSKTFHLLQKPHLTACTVTFTSSTQHTPHHALPSISQTSLKQSRCTQAADPFFFSSLNSKVRFKRSRIWEIPFSLLLLGFLGGFWKERWLKLIDSQLPDWQRDRRVMAVTRVAVAMVTAFKEQGLCCHLLSVPQYNLST